MNIKSDPKLRNAIEFPADSLQQVLRKRYPSRPEPLKNNDSEKADLDVPSTNRKSQINIPQISQIRINPDEINLQNENKDV